MHAYGSPAALCFQLSSQTQDDPAQTLVMGVRGSIVEIDWELDLWTAELTGLVVTTRGTITMSALVPRGQDLVILAAGVSGGEELRWTAGAKCGSALAWRTRQTGNSCLTAAAMADDATAKAMESAVVRARSILESDVEEVVRTHRVWWQNLYTRSLVSIPDKRMQRFYWIQLYHAAATSRGEAWPGARKGVWSLPDRANHTDGLGDALGSGARPVPGSGVKSGVIGNPIQTWGLHDLWLRCRRLGERKVLHDMVLPRLGMLVDYYAEFLVEGMDRRLHLPLTYSPMYAEAADCTYDLALLRWASSVLAANRESSKIKMWHDIATRLSPYHRGPDGVMVGDGVALSASHPHTSHLLWLYPLREPSWGTVDRDLAVRSINHWSGMRGGWVGNSYVTASALSSAMNSTADAHAYLNHFLDRHPANGSQLTPNALYHEGGRLDPSVPLAAGAAVLDLLVHNDGRVISVFPGVPEAWREASISGLRTEGAVLLDAARRNGRTEWVRVHSERGRRFLLRHGIGPDIDVRDERGERVRWKAAGQDAIAMDLAAGDSAIITRAGARPEFAVEDVPANDTAAAWGLPARAAAQ